MALEGLALVDHNDTLTDSVDPSQIMEAVESGFRLRKFLRTSCVFLQNPEGKIWTPRQVASMPIAPGGFDFAMAKHGRVDETYLDTARRGLSEELNIEQLNGLRLIGLLGPMRSIQLPYFSAIYVLDSDGTEPDFSRAHFTGGEWMSRTALSAALEAGMPAKSLLQPALLLLSVVEGTLQ